MNPKVNVAVTFVERVFMDGAYYGENEDYLADCINVKRSHSAIELCDVFDGQSRDTATYAKCFVGVVADIGF